MTELELIHGCIKNEAQCQEALYALYSPKMLGLCFRYSKNREDAEDMLQEGFVKVFAQLHNFRFEGSFEGWVRRIIVHTCINQLKKNKKFSDSIEISVAYQISDASDNVPSMMQAKQVVDCIRLLPIGYRTVLNLFAIEGYSHREISQLLQIEESTSRSQYTRAKNLLEMILAEKKIIELRNIKSNAGGK